MAVHTHETIARVAKIQDQLQFWAGVIGVLAAILALVSLLVGKNKDTMIRAPRRLSAEQIKVLSDRLATSQSEIEIEAIDPDEETLAFATDLAELFHKAGWKSDPVKRSGSLSSHEGYWLAFSKAGDQRAQAEFVRTIFKDAGLQLATAEQTSEIERLKLVVAWKPRFH